MTKAMGTEESDLLIIIVGVELIPRYSCGDSSGGSCSDSVMKREKVNKIVD